MKVILPVQPAREMKWKNSFLRSAPGLRVPAWVRPFHLRAALPVEAFREPDKGERQDAVFIPRGKKKCLLKKDMEEEKRSNRMSLWILLLIIVGWVLLQAYVLPKFGIST